VIVTRSENGEIHVMLNSCRHRGVKLCAADSGNATNFRCGYHGWTYAIDGRLRGVPEAPTLHPNGIDRSKLGLRKARVEVFNGLIFATFDSEAPPLREVFGDMTWYLDTVFKKTEYEAYGPPVRAIGDFNWKSGSENWTGDPYHQDMTHHSVVSAGIGYITDPRTLGFATKSDEDRSGESAIAFTAKGGHAGLHFRIPVEFERPVFPGLEQHLWLEFERNLSAEQIAATDRRMAYLSTSFPNFSVIETVITNAFDNEFAATCIAVPCTT
jgi:phenylpropionate dioxygenase-like ring-hydroxylating dioxygenase large terminal subunit